MEIITSTRGSFRYLWSPLAHEDRFSDYTAARSIAVGHLDAQKACENLHRNASAQAAMAKVAASIGELELVELSELYDKVLAAKLAPLLRTVNGARKPRYVFPCFATVNAATEFHIDMPMCNSIFGAWCLSGPDRIVRFSEMDLEVPFTPGTVLLFDPAQPHALLKPGTRQYRPEDYHDGELCTMVSFVLSKTPRNCKALDVDVYGPRKHANLRTTVRQYAPCPQSGELQFQ